MKLVDLDARYTINHEWARKDGPFFTIGISDFGQTCFKEITMVDLPKIGQCFKKGQVFCVLESSKAANEIEMPISGTVIQINDDLKNNPQIINKDCYKNGWLVKIAASNLKEWQELLMAGNYKKEISEFFRKTN